MLAKHSVNIYLNSVLALIQSVFVPPKLRGTQTSEFTIDVKLLTTNIFVSSEKSK